MAENKKIPTGQLPFEDDEEGESGAGSHIGFTDFITPNEKLRDELLSAQQIEILLSMHNGRNESNVKKQKDSRDRNQMVKNGELKSRFNHQFGMGQGGNGKFKEHKAFKNLPTSIADAQVTNNPENNEQKTNEADQERLEAKLQNTLRMGMAPQSTPRLRRQ